MEMVVLCLAGIATFLIIGQLRRSMDYLQRQRADRRQSRAERRPR